MSTNKVPRFSSVVCILTFIVCTLTFIVRILTFIMRTFAVSVRVLFHQGVKLLGEHLFFDHGHVLFQPVDQFVLGSPVVQAPDTLFFFE